MIFRTRSQRNRLMFERMARNGVKIGEVFIISAGDLEDRSYLFSDTQIDIFGSNL